MADNLEKDIIEATKRIAWIKGSIVGACSAILGAIVGELIRKFI